MKVRRKTSLRPLDPLTVVVEGDTYPIKEVLKSLGFQWDSYYKRWVRDTPTTAELEKIASALKPLGILVAPSVYRMALEKEKQLEKEFQDLYPNW